MVALVFKNIASVQGYPRGTPLQKEDASLDFNYFRYYNTTKYYGEKDECITKITRENRAMEKRS